MTNSLDIIVGIIIGILTNLFCWWLLFHGFSPNLRYSPSICKSARNPTWNNKARYLYRVKLENFGRRAIIDIEIMVRLRLKGLKGYPKRLSQIVYIPLDTNSEIVHKIPNLSPVKKSRTRPIIILYPQAQSEFKNSNDYPKYIVNKAKGNSLLLEDVLKLGTDTYFEIISFGYDQFSGSRKIFISKKYTFQDIRLGSFDQNGLGVIAATDKGPKKMRVT